MQWTLYLRLIVLTAGTLLPFFWMVVILGHRRQRNFERLFFFLCLALTCFFGSSLLALNAELHYGTPPVGLLRFAWTFLCLGLWFVPSLILHLHIEYASVRGLLTSAAAKYLWIGAAYSPAILLMAELRRALQSQQHNFESPSHAIGAGFQAWLIVGLVGAGYWQMRFLQATPSEAQKNFHKAILGSLGALCVFLGYIFYAEEKYGAGSAADAHLQVLGLALVPLAALILGVERFNFLQIGRQRNLIYAVFMVFVALLYLSLVRRASLWLEAYLPPEATAALLLFLPVVFFEPLQRLMRRTLRRTAQTEVDRAQKLMGPITEVARLGDQVKLRKFCDEWIGEQLQLAEARVALEGEAGGSEAGEGKHSTAEERFEIRRGGQRLGWLQVRAYGAMISGETYAALEFLCEQLPGAFDLCRLIEEKLQLERELAERERLALVGQMAASISHNLKNPLGSIKTILQVQMESPELPASLRNETQMVLEEINRLSARLNQLLQFSRPGVRAGSGAQNCNLAQVAETVANVLRHAADERRVTLQLENANGEARAAIGEEAANDILSNVVLNAIEAAPDGGHVRVTLHASGKIFSVSVEDDGRGISAGDQAKVLRPFFTTKARGTGLGLAIVDRRLQDAGGTLEIKSPVSGGRGTEIRLNFPAFAAKDAATAGWSAQSGG
ncbi:MAG TPA: ATP-binding protein [Candidatus Acidoferrum sp.]|nr:ATP-binding protein [Candidatus Acidoferrum sp.]